MSKKRAKQGVTVADLKDSYEGHVCLHCDVCGNEYSACRGDYWNAQADRVFTCDHGASECEADTEDGQYTYASEPPVNMRLVRKGETVVDILKPPSVVSRLDDMACNFVGDGQRPNMFFITTRGHTCAVLRSREIAILAAEAMGETHSVLVEDRLHGEVWGNRTYHASQESEAS